MDGIFATLLNDEELLALLFSLLEQVDIIIVESYKTLKVFFHENFFFLSELYFSKCSHGLEKSKYRNSEVQRTGAAVMLQLKLSTSVVWPQ